MTDTNLIVNNEEVDLVLTGLSQLPYFKVALLIQKLLGQVQAAAAAEKPTA